MKLGPTNKFPRGKLNKNDQGEIAIAIGVCDKTVIIDFGKEISWVGMDADRALQLAALIKEKAEMCKNEGKQNG